MIRKLCIRNYRRFRKFDLDLSSGTNIVIGDNDTGKSTVIEAISLALTGRVHGRFLSQELSPYFINLEATEEYIQLLRQSTATKPKPPVMIIEVYLDGEQSEILRGTNNLCNEDACGLRIQATLSDDYTAEYQSFAGTPEGVRLVPTEYYKVDWLGFSGNAVSARSVPTSASVIDPAAIRLQSGVDLHLQQIVRGYLDPKERVELSRQYRSLREEFSGKESIKAINERLGSEDADLTDRKLSLAIDISQRFTWESSLVAHLDDLPVQLTGQGDQNALKTMLAIGRKASDAEMVLIEEPENHLSFSYLRKLLRRIEEQCKGKQVVVATHSAYVLNKLGLQNLILLGDGEPTRISDLPKETVEYFKKLAGFDTLRLVLAKGAVLVEGPSDELVVQRGYLDVKGHLPIEDGIDVISVGLSHKRFLDLAIRLKRRVWVVTDNDGKTRAQVEARFDGYLEYDFVSLHTGADPAVRTLEPQIVEANDLDTLNSVLGKTFSSKEEVCAAMEEDKTAAALAIFASAKSIAMPEYIQDVFKG